MLQKAMVFTLTAAMLVGTPLTASARGLTDLYKIENGWGDNVDENGNKTDEPHGDPTRTGTITSTNTNSNTGYLKDNALFDGILIDPQDIEENYTAGLVKDVKVIFTKESQEVPASSLPDAVLKKITWKSSNTSVATFESAKNGKTDQMKLRIKGGGRAVITASFNDYVNDIHYTDTINVLITRKAERIDFSPYLEKDAFAGESLVLDDYVQLHPEGSTDKVTYVLVDSGSNPKHKATLKNGVLKLHAKSEKDETVKIVAIGDEVRSDVTTIKIQETIPGGAATFSVKSQKSGEASSITKYDWLINNDGMNGTAEIKLTKSKQDSTLSTDRVVSWTSKKPDIVAVETIPRELNDDILRKGWRVKLEPKSVGTAQIVAKTARGKSFTLKVTVKADLTDAVLDSDMQAYSGQIIQLKATQKFNEKGIDNFTDAGLKWEFAGAADTAGQSLDAKAAGKVASINKSTGVLTVKPSLTYKDRGKDIEIKEIKVKVSASKKNSKGVVPSFSGNTNHEMTVKVKQVNITEIIVYPNAAEGSGVDSSIAGLKFNAEKNRVDVTKKYNTRNPINVEVGGRKSFALYAKADEIEGNAAIALGWTVNNTKLATAMKEDTRGSILGIKKGSPTITVSGSTRVNGKWKASKITMKVNVTQPSQTIQITTKNKAAYKGQNVNFKAVLEKGSSTKANDLEWSVWDVTNNKKASSTISKGKLKIEDSVGTQLMIKARIKDNGKSASMRMWVVEKTTEVTIEGSGIVNNKLSIDGNISSADQLPTLTVRVNGKEPGGDNGKIANVNYTMNKQDYVRIIKNPDGTITLKPIQEGKVTITPVSEDGKPGKKLTVEVGKVTLAEKADGALFSIQ